VRLAVEQAGEHAKGGALASDAFFPFPDGPETAAQAGVTSELRAIPGVRLEEHAAGEVRAMAARLVAHGIELLVLGLGFHLGVGLGVHWEAQHTRALHSMSRIVIVARNLGAGGRGDLWSRRGETDVHLRIPRA